MRFSILTSTLIFIVLIAFTFVNAESYYNVDRSNLIRRADEAKDLNSATMSSSATAAQSTSITKTSEGGAKASSTSEADAKEAKKDEKKKKAAQFGNFATPPILQDGTLFYIGVSVTTLLWVTGKAIDVKTERQERYAERIAHRM